MIGWDDSIKKKGNYLSCVERKGALKILIKVPSIHKSGFMWPLNRLVVQWYQFNSYSAMKWKINGPKNNVVL